MADILLYRYSKQENKQQTIKRKQTKDNKQVTGKRWQAFCPIENRQQRADARQQTKDSRQEAKDN